MIAIFTRRHQGQDRGAGAEERRKYGKAGTVCTGSQMSRIINGKTLKVSHELVIAIAAEFDVSTDFLLGLTSIPDRTRLDELGLSEKAIRNLVSGRVNRKCINHLLEDEELIRLMNNAKPVNKISDDRSEEH